jgi:hypothetical protein
VATILSFEFQTINMKKLISSIACTLVVTLSGCASNKAPVQPKAVKSITLIPAAAPDKLSTENKGVPVGALWTGIANTILDKGKSAEFDTKYMAYRLTMGTKLTEAVMKELQAQGFKVQIANSADVVRDKDGELDYKKFSAHDTVLDLSYNEAGMYSGRVTPHYLPMMSIYAPLVKPLSKEYLMEGSYYYGAYASSDEGLHVTSDAKFRFPGFSDLIAKPELVTEAYEAGIKKTAVRIAVEFRKELVPVN